MPENIKLEDADYKDVQKLEEKFKKLDINVEDIKDAACFIMRSNNDDDVHKV